MPYYRHKGNWVSDTQYEIDDSVLYQGIYYLAKVRFPSSIPTNTIDWTPVTEQRHEVLRETNVSYVQDMHTYNNLSAIADYDYSQLLGNHNGTGLYMFPKKSELTIASDAHFRLMGVDVIYKYAKAFYLANKDNLPNITNVYIVQGKRQENVVTQGFITAAVEAVGYKADIPFRLINSFNITIGEQSLLVDQTTILGDGETKIAFPWIDGDTYRRFPIMKISRERKNSITGNDIVYRFEEDAISEMMVRKPTETFAFTHAQSVPPPFVLSNKNVESNDLLGYSANYASEFNNLGTKRFCIYTPDILLSNMNIVDKYYIKPIIKLARTRNTSDSDNGMETKYAVVSGRGHREVGIKEVKYDNAFPRYFHPEKSNYVYVNNDTVSNAECFIVQENEVNSINNNFSSRMKSIIEVYGDDMQHNDGDLSSTVEGYFHQSRLANMNAGILINRTMLQTDRNVIQSPISANNPNAGDANDWIERRFGTKFLPYAYIAPEIGLPIMVTNLSMKSIPYIGVVFDLHINYMNTNYPYPTYPKESNLNNAIVNVCKYPTIAEYISEVEGAYNLLDEEFHIIGDDSNWNNNNAMSLLKGDVFAQKTFMRCIRYGHLPQSLGHQDRGYWESAWKQGLGFNIYLQSFTNSHLRVPTADSTFYPLVGKGLFGVALEAVANDFIWRKDNPQYEFESWLINSGYNELTGVFKLLPFDDIYATRTASAHNRIYFSNKSVDGAFVDQYRQFPIGQFQDYNFEGGVIRKLAKFNNVLFSIQTRSINQHYGSNELQTSNDSSSILLGDRTILSDQYKQLATFGTQHKESIVSGDKGIYGIDWDKKRIWRIIPSATAAGSVVFGCEDLSISKKVFDIMKMINPYDVELKQDVYGAEETGIVSAYDEMKNEILFTFKLGRSPLTENIQYQGQNMTYNSVLLTANEALNKYYTLVFNEDLDVFMGFYSYDTNLYMQHNNRLFSFALNAKDNHTMWEHNKGDYQTIYDEVEPFEMEFVINCANKEQNASEFEKQFQAHIINSCPLEFDSISWETQYQSSKKEPFINAEEFYSNPEYKEHNWMVPIIPHNNVNNGPNGTNIFNTFEAYSQMKGQWIKVKVKYTGNQYLYIRNIITNFLISFS